MTHSTIVLIAGVAWVLTALAVFLAVGTMSLLGLALLAVVGLGPPLVYAKLSREPAATIAEVLRDTDKAGTIR